MNNVEVDSDQTDIITCLNTFYLQNTFYLTFVFNIC